MICSLYETKVLKCNRSHQPTLSLMKQKYFITLNRTLLFQQSLDPFSRHKDNSSGSVFRVLFNRQIKYKINNTVTYMNVETILIYTYIYFIINFQMKMKTAKKRRNRY